MIIRKNILILGKGATQGLEDRMTAGKVYSLSFTEINKKICRACIITDQIAIYLSMVQKLLNLKQKILKLKRPNQELMK